MSDADAIASQRDAWMAAFDAEDIAKMSQFVTDDHRSMPPNRPQLVGLKQVQDFWKEGFSTAKTTMETHSHDLTIAGDVAIDRFNWKQRITLHDGDKNPRGRGGLHMDLAAWAGRVVESPECDLEQ